MKRIFYFMLVVCFSSCVEESIVLNSDESANPDFCLAQEGGVSQEDADEAYATLLSLLNDKTRSGSNDIEKWYGGSYINDAGELVIRSTNLNLSSRLYIPNTLYEKCDYTVVELEEIRQKIKNLFEAGDSFVTDHIILFGIDPVSNTFEVGMDEVTDERKQYFVDNISSCPAVSFVKCSRPVFSSNSDISSREGFDNANSTILQCGSEIFNYESLGRASLGYRARKKDTGEIGIVTAGHFISKGQVLQNQSKDTIGICIDSDNRNGLLDAAFCKITNENFIPSNIIDFSAGQYIDTLSVELATPAIGRNINMVGFKSKRMSGKVIDDAFDVIVLVNTATMEKKLILTDAMIVSCVPDGGDSGGIVYALNTTLNLKYTVGIICGKYNKYNTPDFQLPTVTYGLCCKANVINRIYGLERY